MSLDSAKQRTSKVEVVSGGVLDVSAAKTLIRTQVKTAAYTVLESDSGTTFTTYGAAASVTFTLPSNPKAGLVYWFVIGADYEVVITGDADSLCTFNDLTATSVTLTTASQHLGACVKVFADGNTFYALNQVDSCQDDVA